MFDLFYVVKYYLELMEHIEYGVEESDLKDLSAKTIKYNIENIELDYEDDAEMQDIINKIKKHLKGHFGEGRNTLITVYGVEILNELKDGTYSYNNDVSFLTKEERDSHIKKANQNCVLFKVYEKLETLNDEQIQCIKDNGYYDL